MDLNILAFMFKFGPVRIFIMTYFNTATHSGISNDRLGNRKLFTNETLVYSGNLALNRRDTYLLIFTSIHGHIRNAVLHRPDSVFV